METNRHRGRAKSEEKRAQILDAATELFLSQGFDAISMEVLAERAGVSKQTVYSHFGNKDELFSAAISAKCEEFKLADILSDDSRPVASVLRELVAQFIKLLLSNDAVCMFRVCATSSTQQAEGESSQVSELFWNSGPAFLMEQLSAYLSRHVELGNLDIDNTFIASKQLLFMVKSDVHMRRVLGLNYEQSEAELPEYLDSCIALFMKGYARS